VLHLAGKFVKVLDGMQVILHRGNAHLHVADFSLLKFMIAKL
jgi:hypothetical protein